MQSVPASPPLSKGSVICDLCVALSVLITIWCTFDRAGRSWVKMTRFQRSMKEGETKYHYKRSGNHRPNWRQRYLNYTSLSSLQLLFYFAKLQCRQLLTYINYTSTFFFTCLSVTTFLSSSYIIPTFYVSRKVMRTYQDTWNHRCKILFCCMGRSDQYKVCLHNINTYTVVQY